MAPATAKALTFESEGHAGNTYDDLFELGTIERVRRLRRLEDVVGAAAELGAVADASGNDRARRHVDLRIEDRAARA